MMVAFCLSRSSTRLTRLDLPEPPFSLDADYQPIWWCKVEYRLTYMLGHWLKAESIIFGGGNRSIPIECFRSILQIDFLRME